MGLVSVSHILPATGEDVLESAHELKMLRQIRGEDKFDHELTDVLVGFCVQAVEKVQSGVSCETKRLLEVHVL